MILNSDDLSYSGHIMIVTVSLSEMVVSRTPYTHALWLPGMYLSAYSVGFMVVLSMPYIHALRLPGMYCAMFVACSFGFMPQPYNLCMYRLLSCLNLTIMLNLTDSG
jgi:hypothetical protein